MNNPTQRIRLVMLKCQLGQGPAIERAIRPHHSRTKPLHNGRVNRLSGLHQLAP
jgi:hypothetical protein